MDRLDLELYADRLGRHHDRLIDEIAGARLRLAWSAFERDARTVLGGRRSALLESVGVLSTPADAGDALLIERRGEQLAALAELQALVEAHIDELVRAREGVEVPP